jgi:hypothetical protein
MNIRIALTVFSMALLTIDCNHEEIILGKVSELPENFSENYHFGKDLRSIVELNDFILVTGKIDTTSESPPLRLAVVSVDHKKIFLTLRKARTSNNEIHENYSGNGYDLNLVFKEKKIQNHSPIYEGYFAIEHNGLKSNYNVVGTSGYY